ncbi:efflux transporter outer membrane subunit [Paraburkholderia bonniea]|uniref:efflux transporter outer membrane subunit n=1 Tax=Paraburkholderia bonniea TaxID=2152891 RepID=UPI0012921E6E|nr:efflux transporter outer membrane subunit [Paraburkholderia bonniea]WJF91878.1 efflux transporter outer membrane subunit [Paraburkholderia bonniea]WJF95197.1 efflux transporter outer membrane subunit [Paraburkholderia bonniea]
MISTKTMTFTGCFIACALAGLAGCAHPGGAALPTVELPPQWSTPQPEATALATLTPQLSSSVSQPDPGTARAMATATLQAEWWRSFNDPVLDQLISRMLEVNNDLAAAGIRAYRARLQAGLVDTNLTPTVTVGASGQMSRSLEQHQTSRSSNLNASLSYELDLWGKLAAQRDAAAWEAHASAEDREATRLTLIGTTAGVYWQLGYLNQQIALGEANIADAQRTLELVQARYAAGAVSGLDLAQAEQNVSSQRAAQTQWLQQREQNRNALALLFNQPPQARAAEPSTLAVTALPPVQPGLPADLLSRRPDLQAAESRLRATLANVAVTRRSLYPSFTLTGSLGTASDTLVRVLQNPVAAVGLGLALPFIQWNTAQLNLKVSQSQYDEALVNFRQRLYGALAEVEDTLSARAQLQAEAQQRTLTLAQASRAQALALVRFRAGATGVQPWIDMQQSVRNAQSAQLSNQLNRLNNQMKLYQALGGGQQ